jgi:tRNA-dihydrouridine synthase A
LTIPLYIPPEYHISTAEMLAIAPMIGWTDKNYRFLIRQITRETQLYTEMVMDAAILHNLDNLKNFIDHSPDIEPPLALQLGGCDPEMLGKILPSECLKL